MIEASGLEEVPEAFFVYARMKCGLYRFFPVGVGTFPTELSGRLRHVFSPAGAGPETLTGYLCLGIGTGNRTGRSEGPPNRETEDDYSAFMQAISLSTSSSVVSKEVTSLISPLVSFQK